MSPVVYMFACPAQLVGVRIPDHDFMRRLCQMCAEPLALTSANISSQTSTVAVHVSGEMLLSGSYIHYVFNFIQYVSQHLNSGWKGFLSLFYLFDKLFFQCLMLLCFFL